MQGTHTERRRLMTVNEVAEYMQVTPAWVRDHSRRSHPRLPVIKLGAVGGKGLIRFHPDAIDDFLQRNALSGD